MTKKTLMVTTILGLVGVVGLATAGQDNPRATPPMGRAYIPSSVIFPDQQIPFRFFHDKHVDGEGMACTDCHDSAEASITSSDVLVPVGFEGEEICSNCHDFSDGAEGDPPAACSTCHTPDYRPKFPEGADTSDTTKVSNRPAGIVIPVPNLKMNHKVHIAKGIECQVCHGDLKTTAVATRENALPAMNTCLECHDGRTAPDECRTCHLTHPDGRMITEFDSGTLKPAGHFRNDAHDDGWLQNHKMSAKGEEQYCANCHTEKYCLDCHNGVMKPIKVHPNNWILSHPVTARRDAPSCSSCHRSQSFCIDCHKRNKVVFRGEFDPQFADQQQFPNGPRNVPRLVGFHPEGWSDGIQNGIQRGPNHHSFHAQRNIRQCAACHTEKTCTGCHGAKSLNSLGVNPHGPGFGGSGKCKSLERANAKMCTACHSSTCACDNPGACL